MLSTQKRDTFWLKFELLQVIFGWQNLDYTKLRFKRSKLSLNNAIVFFNTNQKFKPVIENK